MNTDSVFFISCFLPVCLAVYVLIPWLRGKNAVLLLLGLLFYSFGSVGGVAILVLAALANYLLGLALQGKAGRKPVLIAGIAANLAFLAAYKYLDFVLANVLGLPQLALGLAAPIGISFYTFKNISYLADTWKKPESGTRSFWDFLLYLSFFPQIMAGPITRFADFGPQIRQRSVTLEGVCTGLRRFVIGLSKKLLIAGTLATVADGVFALEGGTWDLRLAWLAAIGYSLQIFFDFSGYSDMAIGLGRVFGFQTPENFDYPYIAPTVGDFWRRWHISLSFWFRDYLYIPLGGNRKGKARSALNKAIVFTLCGVWHGAAWTFLVWGAWHGLLSALESLQVIPARRLQASRGGRILGRVYTLLAVCLGFVMFRAAAVTQGFSMIGAMFAGFSFTDSSTVLLHKLLTGETVAALAAGVLLSMPVGRWFARQKKLQPILEPAGYVLTLVLLVLCIAKLASGGFAPFIYTQF